MFSHFLQTAASKPRALIASSSLTLIDSNPGSPSGVSSGRPCSSSSTDSRYSGTSMHLTSLLPVRIATFPTFQSLTSSNVRPQHSSLLRPLLWLEDHQAHEVLEPPPGRLRHWYSYGGRDRKAYSSTNELPREGCCRHFLKAHLFRRLFMITIIYL